MITNARTTELELALANIQEKYDNNIRFRRYPESISKGRRRFTLRVISKQAGAKIGHNDRRTIYACWHVHGDLFDALFAIRSDIYIKSGNRTITSSNNWQDWDIGSQASPLYYSNACNCE